MLKNSSFSSFDKYFIFVLLLIIYIYGLFVPLNDNDSAHHATIALNMFLKSDWISLVSHGEPYLDKPHFQFWLLYLSYYFLGVTAFSYKISSFIFSLITFYATYKLSLLLFNRKTALQATLITATCFALMMGNVDVRMDAILTGAIVFSVYKFIEYFHFYRFHSLLLATLAAAIAFSTKGWFGTMFIGLIILFYTIQRNQFSELLKPKFLIRFLLLFIVFIAPVLFAYYIQFDLHPELLIRGKNGQSGLKFILLEQSFGRMSGKEFGESSSNDYFFFFHTLLWSILPWSLLYYAGSFFKIKESLKSKNIFKDISLVFVFPIFIIYVIMGLSKFKLPHYMLPSYPFTAIFIASWMGNISQKNLFVWNKIQNVQYALMIAFMVILNFWFFPVQKIFFIILYILLFLFVVVKLFYKPKDSADLIWKGVYVVILFWLPFNTNFFHQLLNHQGGQILAKEVKLRGIDNQNVYLFGNLDLPYSFEYYTSAIHNKLSLKGLQQDAQSRKKIYLYIEEKDLKELKEKEIKFTVLASSIDYRITILTPEFLNPATRSQVLTNVYLIEIDNHS